MLLEDVGFMCKYLSIIIAVLHSRCGHYIFVLFLSIFIFWFLQRLQIGCLPYLYTWCGPSANLERSLHVSNVLHAARWKRRSQKVAKNSPSGHRRTTLSRYMFATKARVDNRKKNG